MVTISICMIVKNEEKILARCLDSIMPIADEVVIVDTGSTDRTKEIARHYTKHIYDYQWVDDFADARNYAFSKCTMDYIYTADADEVMDADNLEQFLQLKRILDPRIEIVQMYYSNQLAYGTVYNFDKEYRPKLYKRLRSFYWQDPIHESVCLEPVIFNSDISILHMPTSSHSKRDFSNYQKQIKAGKTLSKKLFLMYARELYISGEDSDFIEAKRYFETVIGSEALSEEQLKAAQCVLTHCARIKEDIPALMTMSLHNVADGKASAEVCYELGLFYEEHGQDQEAYIWFYNAAFETEAQLNVHYAGDYPLNKLSECAGRLGNKKEAAQYAAQAKEWKIPEPI